MTTTNTDSILIANSDGNNNNINIQGFAGKSTTSSSSSSSTKSSTTTTKTATSTSSKPKTTAAIVNPQIMSSSPSTESTSSTSSLSSSTESILPTTSPAMPNQSQAQSQTNPQTNPIASLLQACPPPLVPNPSFNPNSTTALTSSSANCMGPCCIPCPRAAAFYKQHHLATLYTTNIVPCLGVSSFCAFLILLTHVLLKGRRKGPSANWVYIAAIQVGVICFTLPVVVLELASQGKDGGFPGGKEVQCNDDLTEATAAGNKMCLVQGALFTFGVTFAVSIAAAMIVNLHLLIVWRIKLLGSRPFAVVAVLFAMCCM
ncbi:hypothetical protein HDU76_005508 [Blyttiomyces sp. JEL0837]|nr:hypothetical protein HDU76_005508 [Blyttiomyces sp. JEL0837]